jgi:hypothetical protein
LGGAKPQVFMSDGKQNSGFNSSLEAKAPVVVSGLLFGKMAVSADISLHHKRRRDVSVGDTQQRQSH